MASTINSLSTGSGGITSTGDASGVLALQTNSTTALSIGTDQNIVMGQSLTIGTTAGTGYYAVQAYNTGTTTNAFVVTNTAGYDNAAFKIGVAPYTGSFNTGFVLGVNGATNFQGYVATYTQGTEKMRVNTSGQVLVNTTSATTYYSGASTVPPQHLVVADYDTYYAVSANNTANPGYNFAGPNSAGNRFRYAAIQAPFTTTTAGSEAGALAFHTSSAGGNIAEKMRITSSGQLMVNTTSLTGSPDQMQLYPATTGSFQYGMMIGGNGNGYTVYAMRFLNTYTPAVVGSIVINNTTTSFNTSSDYRLKENIAPLTGALAKVAQLKPVTYKWKSDGSDGEGFIAHELAEVVPQAVTGQKDAVEEDGTPHYQGIDTSFLVATLTAAIQEQQALITQLQADVAALKAKVGS